MVVNPDGTIQFDGDVRKLQSGARGAGAAAAPSPDAEAIRRATARMTGTPLPTGPSNYIAPQPAPAFPGAQGSVPTSPTNPSPVATSDAASKPNFGQRVMSKLQTVGRLARGAAIPGLVAGAGVSAVSDTASTPTEAYEKRFGFGASDIENPILRGIRDMGVRTLGAASDIGNALTLGLAGTTFRDRQTTEPAARPAATAATTTTAASAPTGATVYDSAAKAPVAVQRVLSGETPVPERGTGVIQNNRTGAVTALKSVPGAGDRPNFIRGRPASAATAAAPQLGTSGGLFANLVPFVGEVSARKMEAATSARELNRSTKAAQTGALQAKLGIDAENATSNRIKALSTVEAALAKSREAGIKVVQDAAGNPVVVNTGKNRATVLTPNKPVTEADIQATMKANKLTRAEVEARLRAEGRMD